MKKRILAFFLTVCMVLSLFPAVVFADETGAVVEVTEDKTLGALLADSETTRVKLTKDETIVATIYKNVEIDLNGYELGGSIMVAEGYTVSVIDGAGAGYFAASVIDTNVGGLVIYSAGKIVDTAKTYVSYTSKISDDLKVEVAAEEEIPYAVGDKTFVRWSDAVAAGTAVNVIQNATLNATVSESVTVTVASGKKLTVGTLTLADNVVFTVNGGNISINAISGSGQVVMDSADIVMEQTTAPAVTDAKLTINAGKYGFDASSYLADGLTQLDGLVVVKSDTAVAYVGTAGYDTMSEAIAAANGGKTIVLVKEITAFIQIPENYNVVIELNGNAIATTILNYGTLIVKNELSNDTATVTSLINVMTATLMGGVFNAVENSGTLHLKGATLNGLTNSGALKISAGALASAIASTLTRDDFVDNCYLGVEENGFYSVVKYEAFIINGDSVTGVESAGAVWTHESLTNGSTVELYVNADSFTVSKSIEIVLASGVEITNVMVSDATLTVPVGDSKYTYGAGVYEKITLPVAKIGDVYYVTLQDAVNEAGDGAVIVLVAAAGETVEGDGVKVPSGKNITIDFNGVTYNVSGKLVGSSGTENMAFQLLKNSTVTLKNGTLTSRIAKRMIQNYCDLTLDSITVDGTASEVMSNYTVSHCNGKLTLTNEASILAPEGTYAFDVCETNSYGNVSATVEESAGTIDGNIEYYSNGDAAPNVSLTIAGGTLTGAIVETLVGENVTASNIAIAGGSFEGIVDYEAFYIYCQNGGCNPGLNEDGDYVVGSDETYVAAVEFDDKDSTTDNVVIKYLTIADAISAAQTSIYVSKAQTVKLLKDAETIELANATASFTLDLNGYSVDGIDYSSDAKKTLTVKNSNKTAGALKGTITVRSGKVSLTSYVTVEIDGNLFVIDDGNADTAIASASISGKVTVKSCSEIVTGADAAKLTISGGTFYVEPAYANIASTCTKTEATDDNGSTYYTVAATKPVASVVIDGEEERYGTWVSTDEVVGVLDAIVDGCTVTILQAGEYTLVLEDGITVTLEYVSTTVEKNTIITCSKNEEMFTRDNGDGTYSGYTTFAIVGTDTYCKDVEELTTALAAASEAVDVSLPHGAGELTVNGSEISALTLGADQTIGTLVVEEKAVKIGGLTYSVGTYTNLAYAAIVGDSTVYDSLANAVASGAVAVTAVADGKFEVTANTVTITYNNVEKTYGLGSYKGLADTDVKVGEVYYATIADAMKAHTSTDTLPVTLVRDVEAVEVTLSAFVLAIYAEGEADSIKVLTVHGSKSLQAYSVTIGTLTEDNTANLILNSCTVTEKVISSAGSIYVRNGAIEALELSNGGLVMDRNATTIGTLVLVGEVALSTNANAVINGLNTEALTKVTNQKIAGGTFNVISVDALKPYTVDGYAFAKLYNEDGSHYFVIVSLEGCVAEVDGVLYGDVMAAATAAAEKGDAVKLLVADAVITLSADLTKVIVDANGYNFTVKVADDDTAHYVLENETTYTYEAIVATVTDGETVVNYNSIQAAVDAADGAKVAVLVTDGQSLTIADGKLATLVINGAAWCLGAGEYTDLALVAADNAGASTGSASKETLTYYLDVETAMTANASAATSITLLKDVDELNVASGSYTFAMGGKTISTMNVIGGTVKFSGTGTVATLNVDGGTVTIGTTTLKVKELNADGGTTTVSGGTFTEKLVAKEGTLKISAAAYVVNDDGTYAYYTALTSVKAGVAFMMKDQTKAVTLKYDITVDLNGYTLAELTVYADKTVTLCGSGNVGSLTLNGTLLIASRELKFSDDLNTLASWSLALENPEMLCVTMDANATDEYKYVISDAVISYNGKGYATFAAAMSAYEADVESGEHKIVLYADVEAQGAYELKDGTVLDLNSHTFTCASLTVAENATVTIANGTVAPYTSSAATAMITVGSGAALTLNNVTVKQALKYDSATGVKASVQLTSNATLKGEDLNVPALLSTANYDAPAALCVTSGTIGQIAKVADTGLVCHNHSLVDGACEFCRETAKKLTVGNGITVSDANGNTIEAIDGVYYLFAGDTVTLHHGDIEAGMRFAGWLVTSADAVVNGDVLTVGSGDIRVEADIRANDQVTVKINAPYFTVTGLSGAQLGTATVNPSAGSVITVTYKGTDFLPDSAVVYWVNDNGMIVGKGNTLTYTVSAVETTLTAICHQGNKTDSVLVVFRNGANGVGAKVLNYATVSAADVSGLYIPENAVLGTLNVVGWKLAGTDTALENDDAIRAAISNAIGQSYVVYFEPAVSKEAVTVTVTDNAGAVLWNEEVYAAEYSYITAPEIDGKFFSHWIVDGVSYNVDTLVYKFNGNESVVAVYVDNADEVSEKQPMATLEHETAAGQITLVGILQLPEGYTMVDAGLVYSTAVSNADELTVGADNVTTRSASGLEGKSDVAYTLSLTTSKTELTLYARAFVTYMDADNNVITIYSDGVTVIEYSANA